MNSPAWYTEAVMHLSYPTVSTVYSMFVMQGTIRACNELLDRMKPVRDKNPDLPWKELVLKCFHASVDLSAKAL